MKFDFFCSGPIVIVVIPTFNALVWKEIVDQAAVHAPPPQRAPSQHDQTEEHHEQVGGRRVATHPSQTNAHSPYYVNNHCKK